MNPPSENDLLRRGFSFYAIATMIILWHSDLGAKNICIVT